MIHFPVESHYTTRTAPRLVSSTKLSPVRRSSHLDEWPTMYTTCCNNFFFPSLLKAILKTAQLPSLVSCRFFYFSAICSSLPPVRIHVYLFTTLYEYTADRVVRILPNSLDFWSSKTITSILLLSVVLLKPCCHHYNPRHDILHSLNSSLFVLTWVPQGQIQDFSQEGVHL